MEGSSASWQEPLLADAQLNGRVDKLGFSRKCTWLQTTSTLLTLQLGWGLWLLPSDFAKLGWAVGLGCLLGLGALTVYSGFMFSRLYAAVPRSVLLGDIGQAAKGRLGRVLVYMTIYSLDATRCIILHLAASQSLLHAFPEGHRPHLWQCAAVVAVVVVLLGQVRNMTDLSWICMVGTFAQLVALGIVVYDMVLNPVPDVQHPILPANLRETWRDAVTAVFNMVFAFGGQFAFLEIIMTMKKPQHFPRSVGVCTVIMTLLYGGLGAAGYGSKGNTVDGIVVFHVTGGVPLACTAAGLIFLQAIAQYLVNLNVWAHNLLVLMGRANVPEEDAQMAGHGADGLTGHEGLGFSQHTPEMDTEAPVIASTARDPTSVTATGSTDASMPLLPTDMPSEVPTPDSHSPVAWLTATVFIALYSAFIAVVVPFFSTLVALVTSVTYLTCAYTLPAWFTLSLLRGANSKGASNVKRVGFGESLLLRGMIVLSVLASGVGLYASVLQYMHEAGGGEGDFN